MRVYHLLQRKEVLSVLEHAYGGKMVNEDHMAEIRWSVSIKQEEGESPARWTLRVAGVA